MARNTIGSKYESVKNLSRVEIAKLIRQDIKSAIAKQELPQIKISLRCDGHNHITLKVTEMSDGILLYNPEYLEAEYVTKDPQWIYRNREPGRYTAHASAILSTLESIVEAYNYDKSEIETDYFNVNFYTTIGFSSDITEARIKSEMEPATFARNLKIVRDARDAAFVKREQERLQAEAQEATIRRAREERIQAEIQAEQARAIANPPSYTIPTQPAITSIQPATNPAPRRESIAEAAERVRLTEEREAAILANRPRVELENNLRNWRSRQAVNAQRQRISRVALFFACMACNSSGRDTNHRVCTYCAGDRETTNAQNERFLVAKEAELSAMPPLRALPEIPSRPAQYAVMNGAGVSPAIVRSVQTLPQYTQAPIAQPAKVEAPKNEDPSDEGPHAYIAHRFANLEID